MTWVEIFNLKKAPRLKIKFQQYNYRTLVLACFRCDVSPIFYSTFIKFGVEKKSDRRLGKINKKKFANLKQICLKLLLFFLEIYCELK